MQTEGQIRRSYYALVATFENAPNNAAVACVKYYLGIYPEVLRKNTIPARTSDL